MERALCRREIAFFSPDKYIFRIFTGVFLFFCIVEAYAESISFSVWSYEYTPVTNPEQTLLIISEPSLYKRKLIDYIVDQFESDDLGLEEVKIIPEEQAYLYKEIFFGAVLYMTSWNKGDSSYLSLWKESNSTIDVLLYTKLNPYEEKEAASIPIDAITTASKLENIDSVTDDIFSALKKSVKLHK